MDKINQLSEMDRKLDVMVDDYKLIRRELPKHIILNNKIAAEMKNIHVTEIPCGFGSIKKKSFRDVEVLISFVEPFIRLMD